MKNVFTPHMVPCYICPKLRGPVTQKHQRKRGCNSHLEAEFCHAQIFGSGASIALPLWLRGVVGATRKDVRTAFPVFLTTTLHPMHSKMQTVVSLTRKGAKTMTAKPITNTDAIQHLNSAKAKLQKAILALGSDTPTVENLNSAIGQTISAGRSLKRAAEANKPSSSKQEG